MQNELYQVITPVISTTTAQNTHSDELMTFSSEATRNRFIREQRAYGEAITLSYRGTNSQNVELYAVTRRVIK